MKICQNCFQEFEDAPYATAASTPADVLGEIFLKSVGHDDPGGDAQSLCPACRKELGIDNLLGFGL